MTKSNNDKGKRTIEYDGRGGGTSVCINGMEAHFDENQWHVVYALLESQPLEDKPAKCPYCDNPLGHKVDPPKSQPPTDPHDMAENGSPNLDVIPPTEPSDSPRREKLDQYWDANERMWVDEPVPTTDQEQGRPTLEHLTNLFDDGDKALYYLEGWDAALSQPTSGQDLGEKS